MRVAHKRGKLKRGGVPDLDATARVVLHDWNDGRIPFFTRAPPVESRAVCNTQIISDTEAAEQMPIDDIALAGAGAMVKDDIMLVLPVGNLGPFCVLLGPDLAFLCAESRADAGYAARR